jgi:DNA-directed RNA polymerase subunit RPC12/RpoP
MKCFLCGREVGEDAIQLDGDSYLCPDCTTVFNESLNMTAEQLEGE